MPFFSSHDYSVLNNEAKMWCQAAIVDSITIHIDTQPYA